MFSQPHGRKAEGCGGKDSGDGGMVMYYFGSLPSHRKRIQELSRMANKDTG